MRYAIFSDIHANRQAWGSALVDIRQANVDVVVCLGDTVGYGPMPEEVLKSVNQEVDIMVLGNHDAAAFGGLDIDIFNDEAKAAIKWTQQRLSQKSKEALRKLPLTAEKENILFVHAEVINPAGWGYINTIDEAKVNFALSDHFVTFVGHTHRPTIFDQSLTTGQVREHPDQNVSLIKSHRYIINVGSVGDPRSPDDLRGRYVIYESDTRTVYFRKFTFNTDLYRLDQKKSGMNYTPFFIKMLDHETGQQNLPGAKK
ncbi:MAG: metallophosphoesterase family protein [Verrucomicrobiota bacterium]